MVQLASLRQGRRLGERVRTHYLAIQLILLPL